MIRGKFGITKSKYKNVRKEIDGVVFDSTAEAECFQMLKLLERNGQIKIIELQPKVYLTRARILYKPDFKIDEGGKIVFIDVKGKRTTAFQIKKRLWRHYGEGVLRLVQKNGFAFDLVEEIRTVADTSDRNTDTSTNKGSFHD